MIKERLMELVIKTVKEFEHSHYTSVYDTCKRLFINKGTEYLIDSLKFTAKMSDSITLNREEDKIVICFDKDMDSTHVYTIYSPYNTNIINEYFDTMTLLGKSIYQVHKNSNKERKVLYISNEYQEVVNKIYTLKPLVIQKEGIVKINTKIKKGFIRVTESENKSSVTSYINRC